MHIRFSQIDKQMEDINLKMINFETLSIFGKGDDNKKYSNDELSMLVNALDKKLTQKISYIDNRFLKIEEDILKLKQFEKALEQTNRNLDQTTRNSENNKEQIVILFAKLEDLKANVKSTKEMTDKMWRDELENLKNYIDEKVCETNETIQNLLNLPKDSASQNVQTVIDDSKIKELGKKIIELEKSFKVFSAAISADQVNNIKSELARLAEALETKASKLDLSELKDYLLVQINFLKDNVTQLLEDRKISDELNWLRKKVESLSSSVLSLKNNDESNNNSYNKILPIDSSKFVEVNTFNEFKAAVGKEFDGVNIAINELRRLIEEILLQLKTKVTDKDLRNLEDYLMTKIEEVKSACNKKFADKNETAKNLKYLDGQIKHIIEVYIKKMEKGDNWLLAKKPIGGYSCASCEAYIGDLHDNTQYVPWNKYPMRDPNDKLYRIGNGFSKMLQMINVEGGNMNKPRPTQTSYEFYKGTAEGNAQEVYKKDIQLPRVRSHKKNLNGNMSADDADMEDMDNMDDPLQPKM